MIEVKPISTQKPENAAFDYGELRKIGIQHIEKTASFIWTDYNIHDPGITTLELLCYILTDLSNRCTYSIPDLLATERDNEKNSKAHFFSAARILPNKAVTINDYRKLLIDMEGVKNAWLKKRTKRIFADLINQQLCLTQPSARKWSPVDIKGYYDVLLEFDTNIQAKRKTKTKTQAHKLLMSNRNLCEDFVSVEEVTKQEFRLCCELEVKNDADALDTLARIFFNIQLYLTPLIKFYWLKDLFNEKYTSDKIFEGPLLTHGFIKEEDLIASGLKTEIYLSDIMKEILKVDAVVNITDILFNPTGTTEALANKWIIDVADGQQPVVNILQSNVLLYKDGIPFRPNPNLVKTRFDRLMAEYIAGNDLVRTEDISYDTGTYQDFKSYYSICNHYPKNYGIGHWGLPDDVSDERKMQVKQLKGYLFFFDQQLANYLSQLSHLRNLFSIEDERQTYFTQLVNDDNDAEGLFVNRTSISQTIQSAAEATGSDLFYQRRNLFLDHLLSRFAESFFDYVSILHSLFPENQQELITTKKNFLKNYPDYSSHRFCAYNDTDGANLWESENISGVEKRLQRLLGLSDIRRRTLVNIYAAIRSSTDASNTVQFWYELIDNRSLQVLLKANEKVPVEETAKEMLDNALEHAKAASNFTLVTEADSSITYQLKDETGKLIGLSNDRYASAGEAQADIAKLASLLALNPSEEGMYLVEHGLLLPEPEEATTLPSPPESPLSPIEPLRCGTDVGFMPICVDENCADCDSLDPYSFHISIILPAYAPRFSNMDFRRYCERTIRMETPAHILPKICWVNNEQLQEFEKAYQHWLGVKAGMARDADHSILKRLIKILTTLKSVYPPARLEDCQSIEERKLFLLNQNVLGTLKK